MTDTELHTERMPPCHEIPSRLPAGKEYKSWRIVRYHPGTPHQVEKVRAVSEYLAEDYTVLAFKLLSLKPDYVYEVQWYYK